jgi:hypothetical protein
VMVINLMTITAIAVMVINLIAAVAVMPQPRCVQLTGWNTNQVEVKVDRYENISDGRSP